MPYIQDVNGDLIRMAKATKFIARYEGKIVGTRKSPRPYLFAVVVKDNEEFARERAYGFTGGETERKNFVYYTNNANAAAPGVIYPGERFKITAEMIAEGREKIAGGFDGYIAGLRELQIARFKEMNFEPGVFGWSMSRANAEKMAAGAGKWPGRIVLAIVPAETA